MGQQDLSNTRVNLETQKPFLIRAIYDWMITYQYTPQIQICPLISGCILPDYLLIRSEIILSISPKAITNLLVTDDAISFKAIFRGMPFAVKLPLTSVAAIVALEEEVGYLFDIDQHLPLQWEDPDYSKALGPQNDIEYPPEKTHESATESSKLRRLWPFSLKLEN